MTATYNMYVRQGETHTLSITWKEDGEPVDLTGWTGLFQLRPSWRSETVLLEYNTAPGLVLGTTDGTISLEFAAADTTAIVVSGNERRTSANDETTWYQIGHYGVKLIGDDQVVRILEGRLFLSPEIVR
jgi:hypothetical protein